MAKRKTKKLPAPRMARVPAERVELAAYVADAIELIGWAAHENRKRRLAEMDRLELEGDAGKTGRRQALDIAREFVRGLPDRTPDGLVRRCHRGKLNSAVAQWQEGDGDPWAIIAAIEAGQDRMRRIVHGQEVVDELERHGWCGNEERVRMVFDGLVREGLVDPELLRMSEAPRWCKAAGKTLFAGKPRPHHDMKRPTCCWWVVNDA